ncbi:MAG: MerR family transcriptional regulator [Chloroflexota bacterium]|nr:MerR family transcriptional regulator [Chloroflexota bacterium]
MGHTVGEVARLTGVTVRALHHYDEIGLLAPGGRTAAGYRRYAAADLDRLQHILAYRALGFPLDQITVLLDDPAADMLSHLRRQHQLLSERQDHTRRMLTAVERMMEAQQMGYALTPEERFEVWGEFNPEDHVEEAAQRWGDSDAYRQSQARAKRYTKEDWLTIKREGEATTHQLAAAMAAGTPATSPAVMDLAEEHRRHISRWFYDCTHEIHRGLGQMYVDDPRFTATYEGIAPGLAVYLRDAIMANADRHE